MVTFITGNFNKARQVERYLGIAVAHKKIELDEIQSLNLSRIVEYKTKQAFKILGCPVLVEDVSITISAFGKLPGPFIKWFEQEIGNEKLCRMLDLFKDRMAIIEVMYGFYDGKVFKTFSAKVKGRVADEPRGERGFGFDPVFIPDGYNLTRGQMNEEDFNKSSHRRMVLEKVQKFLTSSLN